MPSPTKDKFYIGSILAALFRLLICVLLTGIGIVLIPNDPKLGWACAILFGTMGVISVIDIVRQCGLDQDKVPDVKSQLSIRRALVPVGVTVVTLFLGFADNLLPVLFTNSFPRPAVWCATFVTTLAFYPLREQTDLNIKLWIIFCALMGVASVVLSYIKDWLEIVLT